MHAGPSLRLQAMESLWYLGILPCWGRHEMSAPVLQGKSHFRKDQGAMLFVALFALVLGGGHLMAAGMDVLAT